MASGASDFDLSNFDLEALNLTSLGNFSLEEYQQLKNKTGNFTWRPPPSLGLPGNGIDPQMRELLMFQYYSWGVAGNIIAAFGIPGNIISIFILANRRMRSSTSWYLIALAIYDTFVLVSLIMNFALPTITFATQRMKSYHAIYPYLQPYAYPLALTAQTCSIYTTVGFTIERFIAVCYPLRAANLCSIEHARRATVGILLCSIIYNIPRMLEYRVVETTDPYTNLTSVRNELTDLGANTTFRHIYFIYMYIVVMLLLPFVVLAVLNTMLIRAVRRSARTEGRVNNRQRRENNLTVMLIAVVVVFLMCQVTSIADNIFAATLSEEILKTPTFVKLTCISNLMVITNSAVNFYLYCMFGQKFRHIFCRTFCTCCGRLSSHFQVHESSFLQASQQRPTHTVTGNERSRSPLLLTDSEGKKTRVNQQQQSSMSNSNGCQQQHYIPAGSRGSAKCANVPDVTSV